MLIRSTGIIFLLTIAALLLTANAQTVAPAADPSSIAQPFAIIELFTSEGCSSCPRPTMRWPTSPPVLAELASGYSRSAFMLITRIGWDGSIISARPLIRIDKAITRGPCD